MSKVIVDLDHFCFSEISEKGIWFFSLYKQACEIL